MLVIGIMHLLNLLLFILNISQFLKIIFAIFLFLLAVSYCLMYFFI